ncbi:MAG: hypothetical protein HWN66_00085 [Candidatus Helarchaeota archaeon]|nr:hypothetical protein [Candidatus Helarchaeota archaeon]
MAGHLGFLIAGGATAPGGVTFIIMAYMFKLMSIDPVEEMMRVMSLGFFIAGLCLTIFGSIFLIIGLYKYRNRELYYK